MGTWDHCIQSDPTPDTNALSSSSTPPGAYSSRIWSSSTSSHSIFLVTCSLRPCHLVCLPAINMLDRGRRGRVEKRGHHAKLKCGAHPSRAIPLRHSQWPRPPAGIYHMATGGRRLADDHCYRLCIYCRGLPGQDRRWLFSCLLIFNVLLLRRRCERKLAEVGYLRSPALLSGTLDWWRRRLSCAEPWQWQFDYFHEFSSSLTSWIYIVQVLFDALTVVKMRSWTINGSAHRTLTTHQTVEMFMKIFQT